MNRFDRVPVLILAIWVHRHVETRYAVTYMICVYILFCAEKPVPGCRLRRRVAESFATAVPARRRGCRDAICRRGCEAGHRFACIVYVYVHTQFLEKVKRASPLFQRRVRPSSRVFIITLVARTQCRRFGQHLTLCAYTCRPHRRKTYKFFKFARFFVVVYSRISLRLIEISSKSFALRAAKNRCAGERTLRLYAKRTTARGEYAKVSKLFFFISWRNRWNRFYGECIDAAVIKIRGASRLLVCYLVSGAGGDRVKSRSGVASNRAEIGKWWARAETNPRVLTWVSNRSTEVRAQAVDPEDYESWFEWSVCVWCSTG